MVEFVVSIPMDFRQYQVGHFSETSMLLDRSDVGVWTALEEPDHPPPGTQPDFLEAIPRYLTLLDAAFLAAKNRSEGDFVLTLLGISGTQDAGWDPYETTLKTITSMSELHAQLKSEDDKAHLRLWLYGHIMEASEPYNIVGNLAAIAGGAAYHFDRFPPRLRRRGNREEAGPPMSPSEKIQGIEGFARAAGLPDIAAPFREPWDRNLRNAVFHADYSLYGDEIRTIRPARKYPPQELLRLINRALALFHAVRILVEHYKNAYSEPVVIPGPQSFRTSGTPVVRVMVREGDGVIGITHAWTEAQLASGHIPFMLARLFPDEDALLRSDRTRAHFPARPEKAPTEG